MSAADVYQHNPWRFPGNAPVYDACGMAGGSPTYKPTQLSFVDTQFAQQGNLGSKVLPKAPTGVVWAAGANVEAKWSLRANHGGKITRTAYLYFRLCHPSPLLCHPSLIFCFFQGGYSYRVCPLASELTEGCFQRHPIPFAKQTFLEFGNGTRIQIEGRFLSNGTQPAGSQWAMNPLPFASGGKGAEFQPPCIGPADLHSNTEWGLCAGRFPIDVSIVDVLQIPASLAAGEYVLGFRYDCEATAQVWASCADITVVDTAGTP
jgi:hypothetical protein